MIFRLEVIGIKGNPIRVIFVPKDEKCPNHNNRPDNDSLVEFYDLRYTEGFTPDGQFISSYYLSTLKEQSSRPNTGLDLMGDVSSWKIDARAFSLVKDWLAYHTYTKPNL
jgi:hypothetical protein